MKSVKPLYLLADSQLLFIKNEKQEYYLKSFVSEILDKSSACAYIGASNGDEPEYYELFREAMSAVGLVNCRMISSFFNKDDQEFLDRADLILLAGGDAEKGLKFFREKEIEAVLRRRYEQGAILIGVSAGAVQLGWISYKKIDDQQNTVTDALKIIPLIVLVHGDKKNSEEVETVLKNSDTIKRAYEISMGAGMIYYPDHSVEAIRKPINEFILKEDKLVHTLILPTSLKEEAVSLTDL